MKIVRHRTSQIERNEIARLSRKLSAVQPGKSLEDVANLERYHIMQAGSLEVAYRLRLDEMGCNFAAFHDLRRFLDQLTNPDLLCELLILEDLPIANNIAGLMLVIGSLFGEVREFVGHGAPIIEVADHGQIVQGRPSSDNALEFKLHTDLSFYEHPPAFAAFLMVQPARDGGESMFTEAAPALARLPPDTIAALQTPFEFPPSLHRPDTGPQFFPILTRNGYSGYDVRYRRDGLRALNPQQEAALIAWEREIDRDTAEFPLAAGEMAIFSNRRLLHGRRRFRNGVKKDRPRSAMRVYIDHSVDA